MSAATASIADVFRNERMNKDDRHGRNLSAVLSQAQCTPVPLPALGTPRIVQGNGTTVGTVISLQCPAKHRLIGGDLTCVMDHNSTHWVGETYCKPLSSYEEYGFRVAVLASIVSSAIILLMSAAFITCCWLDCIKEDKKRQQERESDLWQWEEQPQNQEDNRSRYTHQGRNNNNNNAREKMLWEGTNPLLNERMRPCRCQQQYAAAAAAAAGAPARTYGTAPPLAALPGRGYDQPLSDPAPPEYPGPPLSSGQSPSLVHISAVGSMVWQYGGPQGGPSGPAEHGAAARNMNPKEFSIRIISV